MSRVNKDGKRVIGLAVFLVLAVTLGGCIFLDADRRDNFTGPSWDVPFAVPLSPKQKVRFASMFEDMLESGVAYDDVGNAGISIPMDPIEERIFPDDWELPTDDEWPDDLPEEILEQLRGALPGFVASFEEDVEMSDLPDLDVLDGFSVVLNELVFALTVTTTDLPGVLELEVVPVDKDGVEGEGAAEVIALGGEPQTVTLKISAADKPHTLRFRGTLTIEEVVNGLDASIRIEPELWVPLKLRVSGEHIVDLGDPIALELDDDARDTLRGVPISEVALVLDVETQLPFGVGLAVKFLDGMADSDGASVELKLPQRTEFETQTLAIGPAVRDKLVSPDAHMAVELTLNGDGSTKQINRNDYFALKAHAIVTVEINSREEDE